MKRKKMLIYSGLAILLLAGLASVYGYREFNRTAEDTADLSASFKVDATGLIAAFESNESQANQQYRDKVILVKGQVKDIVEDDAGMFTISLGDQTSMSSVRCVVDSLHSGDVASLREGAVAGLKGVCSGFNADDLLGSDVLLVRCALVTQ